MLLLDSEALRRWRMDLPRKDLERLASHASSVVIADIRG